MERPSAMMHDIPNKAKLFILMVVVAAAAVSLRVMLDTHPWHHQQFFTLLVISLLASRLKMKLPGLNGNMSMNLPFILIAQVQLSPREAFLVACASTLVQCLPATRSRLNAIQVLFNIATMAVAVEAGRMVFHNGQHFTLIFSEAFVVALAALAFLLANTLPVAGVISLSERVRMMKTWSQILHLSFPYYVASAGITSVISAASHYFAWYVPLLVLAVAYGMYRSFQRYFTGMELMPRLRTAMAAETYSINIC